MKEQIPLGTPGNPLCIGCGPEEMVERGAAQRDFMFFLCPECGVKADKIDWSKDDDAKKLISFTRKRN